MIVGLVLCAAGLELGATAVAAGRSQDTLEQEADRLATLLKWHAGSVVAEIGAGNGKLTIAAAEKLGPSGKVYTTELDPKLVANLKGLATNEKNVVVLQAGATDTNLPMACCESIFMRLVYHHLTRPAEIDKSLFRSLKARGLLAVVDEEPREGTSVPEGVPQNRRGHGIPQEILIRELTSAGFKVESVDDNWPGRDPFHEMYCVVFRKEPTLRTVHALSK